VNRETSIYLDLVRFTAALARKMREGVRKGGEQEPLL
jgi:hypothetical protein